MKPSWTRSAWADRRSIREYIAADNPRAALTLDELFSEKANRLVANPGIGRPGRVSGTRELIAHQSYILVYEVTADSVRVLRVLDAARKWPPQASGN